MLLAEGKQALAGQAPGAKDSACPGQQGKVETGGFYPFPGNLSNPGIEPGSATLQADSLPSEPPGKPNILVRVG